MKKSVANTVILLVAVMALLIGLSVNRLLSPTLMSHEQMSENGLFVYERPRSLEEFALVDHEGEAFNLAKVQGDWTLIFFGFTFCPDICPMTLASLSQFTSQLEEETDYAENTKVVMVTVDPERDTLERLGEYVGYFDEDFRGVTGEYIDIFNFARQLNIAFNYLPQGEEGDYLVSHSGEVVVINPAGHFHGFFKYPPQPDIMMQTYASMREGY